MNDKKTMLNRIIDFYVGRNDLKETEIKTILDLKNDLKAINYKHCCKSDSEQFNCYEMHAYSRFAGCSKQCKECEDNEKSKAI